MTEKQQLETQLWNIANTLRGKMEADAFAIFNLDEQGKAESIKMKGISQDIDFSYDFQDLDLQRVEK